MTRSVSRVKLRKTKAENLLLLKQLAPKRKIQAKGKYNRRITIDYTFGKYNFMYHATKGWRKRRV